MARKTLNESNLKSIEHLIKTKDIAGISAYRGQLIDVVNRLRTLMDIEYGVHYTRKQNSQRNYMLKAKLLTLGYGVTTLSGSYQEIYQDPVVEKSFIVVNLKDDINFKANILTLSEWFNQDSFLYKAKDNEQTELIGTNYAMLPGYGVSSPTGPFRKAVNARFMSYMSNTDFAFSIDDEGNPVFGEDARRGFLELKEQQRRKYPPSQRPRSVSQEIQTMLMMETFESMAIMSKWPCSIISNYEQMRKMNKLHNKYP